MRKFLVLSFAFLLAGCSIPFLGGKKSGLKITTTPPATVILDGKQVGQTPFDQSNLKPKSYKLQLIPQSGQPWETTVTLYDNLQAVVERIFGQSDQESEGAVMELEPWNNKSESQLSVITIPDPATVRIDGQPRGFAPLTIALGAEGNHEVVVSSAGYNEKKAPLSVPKGYKLHLTVQLSRTLLPEPTPAPKEEATPSATPTPSKGAKAKGTPTPAERPYVEILQTPTGWLRVRSDPSTGTDNEIAKVNPGETYKFLKANESGWYQIALNDGREGWISGQYAKLFR